MKTVPIQRISSPERATLANTLSRLSYRDGALNPEAAGVQAHHFNYIDMLAYRCRGEDAVKAVVLSDGEDFKGLIVARFVTKWQSDQQKSVKLHQADALRGDGWVVDQIGIGSAALAQMDVDAMFDTEADLTGAELLVTVPILNPRRATKGVIGVTGLVEYENPVIGADLSPTSPSFISHSQLPTRKPVYPGYFAPLAA